MDEEQGTTEGAPPESTEINLDEIQVTEKADDKIDEEEKPGETSTQEKDETAEDTVQAYLPWITAAGLGLLLLVIAVALMASAGKAPLYFPYKPQDFNVPNLQGSLRVYSVGDQKLKYKNELRYIGSKLSRNLRYRVEPQLKYIYSNASLPVENVVVLSFKYGGAGETSTTQEGRSLIARSSNPEDDESSIIVRHWVYLSKNLTDSIATVQQNILAAIEKVQGIKVDKSSFTVESLENMTRVEAIQALTQAGFFKNGLKGLDLQLLDIFGLSFGLQTDDEEEGLCSSQRFPRHGTISPSTCTQSINTYPQMACQFSCDEGYELVGSPKRICMSSGLWSGELPSCKKMCEPVKSSSVMSVQPPTCSYQNMSSGQMCFLECPSSLYKLEFPPETETGFSLVQNKDNMWPTFDYSKVMRDVEKSTDARSYYRECTSDGHWSGTGGSCKAKCSKLYVPLHGSISPSNCLEEPVEGQQCVVSCDSGYGMTGGGSFQILTCDVSGGWTDKVSTCQKLCTSLVESSNLIITPEICLSSAHESLKCDHECPTGYVLDGVKSRTCKDGNWDFSSPTCIRTCDPIVYPSNGIVVSDSGLCSSGDMVEGTECTLHCDVGYLRSRESVTCQASGLWTFSDLECIKTCQKLSLTADGTWSPSSCHGDHHSGLGACTLTCDPGKTLQGTASLTCSDEGVWSDDPGTCIVNCLALSAPTNGALESKPSCSDGSATLDTTCRFSCDAGYGILGENTLQCTDSGWSDSAPTCQIEKQYLIAQHWDGHVMCLAVVDNAVRKIKNTNGACEEENARWDISNNLLRNVAAQSCLTRNGSFSMLHLGDCVVSNTEQQIESGFGLTLKFIGTESFITSGYRTIIEPQLTSHPLSLLDENIQWRFHDAEDGISGTNHTLFSLLNSGNCMPLDIDSSVDVSPTGCKTNPQSQSTSCTLSCTASTLSHPSQSSVTCTDGVWDVDPYIYCIPSTSTSCPSIAIDADWDVTVTPESCTTGATSPGGACEFECNNSTEKYLDGPTSVMCISTGRWSSQPDPVCKPRCSSLLPVPKNSYLVTADAEQCSGYNGLPESGSVCSFSCIQGKEVVGESVLTCMDDGEWSYPIPKCSSMCNDLHHIERGFLSACTKPVTYGQYESGTRCNFTCSGQYVPGMSYPILSCSDSGFWIMAVRGKLECVRNCPGFTNMSENHMRVTPYCIGRDSTIEQECSFSCDEGYGLDIADGHTENSMTYKRECLADGTWSGSVVMCTKRCPPLAKLDDSDYGYYDPPECVTSFMRVGSKCNLHCLGSNAIYNGTDTLTCSEDGNWSPTDGLGQCSPACESLEKSDYITISPRSCTDSFVKAGTKCVLTCPDHMERIGSGVKECIGMLNPYSGSRWSDGYDTYCVERCPPLVPSHGSYVFPSDCEERYKIEGDHCSFECNSGYQLSGSYTLSCLSSGQWNSEVPVCVKQCPPINVPNGVLYCSDAFGYPVEGLGYEYMPGTKCSYFCATGFTSFEHNEISCNEDGMWTPAPRCSPVSDTFPIIQKIGDESVCLQVSQHGLDGSTDGAEWHLTLTENSTEGCQAAGNNAMWVWFSTDHVKHAETGLCLTADSALQDATLLLQDCDVSNALQQWACDAEHPYRFVLKGTILSIDTKYKELGPVLQTSTEATTYWITYNSNLETAATICSNKILGACPAISKPFMKAVPEVCQTEEVSIWQKCALSCDEGSDFDGTASIVECLPTGEWKQLDEAACRQKCPALPDIRNGTFDKFSCNEDDNMHQTVCSLSCEDEFSLSTYQDVANFTCDNGRWIGPIGVSCQKRCKDLPPPPQNGRIECLFSTCRVVCNLGFKSENVSEFDCSVASEIANDTCVEEYHFRMQLETASFAAPSACMTGVIVNGDPKVNKIPCDIGDTFQYWRWEDSWNVIDDDYSMLQNIGTNLCLAASSVESWSEITLSACNKSHPLQQWTCHNYLHPGRLGLVSYPNSYVDAGSTWPFSPPVLRDDDLQLKSADWISVDFYGVVGYACASRSSGSCPKLQSFPSTTFQPEGCTLWDGLPSEAECVSSCDDANFELSDGNEEHSITCLENGAWSENPVTCVAKSSASGTCSPILVHTYTGLSVSPAKCNSVNGQDLLVGDTCTFSCDYGYFMKGEEQISCEGGDAWTATVPECVAYCAGIQEEKGILVNDTLCESVTVPQGTICNKTCSENFLPSDNSPDYALVTCMSDGTWSDVHFSCEATCPPLSLPPYNATSDIDELGDPNSFRRILSNDSCIEDRIRPRTICNFYCGSGNVTVGGESSVSCGLSGTWMGDIPRCAEENYCPRVAESMATTVFYETLLDDVAISPGTVVKIKCAEGYIPDGDDIRVCEADGMWGGKGPVVPQCVKKCLPLIPPFGAEIDPHSCTTGYVGDGQGCTYTCIEGTAMTGGDSSKRITCNNGTWSDDSPECLVKDANNLENMNVYSRDDGFLIITRSPEAGCLYAAEDRVVKWRSADECDPRQTANRWKWHDSQRITNSQGNLCMQPLNESLSEATLGVGLCNTTFTMGCGNPKSTYFKYTLFSFSNPKWRLLFDFEYPSIKIKGILMVKSDLDDTAPPNSIDGLMVYGNADIMNPVETDVSVCSFMCGGAVYFDNDYQTHTIVSPGFIHNQQYPMNSFCKWTFYSDQKVLHLSLKEIKMEDNGDDDRCNDCVKVYEGDSSHGRLSNRIASFSGNNIDNIYPIDVKSVSASVHVSFISNGDIQGRGFAIDYKFLDPPAKSSCGVRGSSDESSGETNADELQAVSSNIRKWPWLVSIREKFIGSSKAYHRCTGALISNRVVITAAHCLRFMASAESGLDIGIGLTLQNDMNRVMREGNAELSTSAFHVYHSYDSVSRNGDIALWRLSMPVVVSDTISPICLPSDGFPVHEPRATCYSAGWSSLTQGTILNQLSEYKVKMVSSSWCKKTLGLGEDMTFSCGENINFDTSGRHETTESEPLMCKYNSNWYLTGVRSYTHMGSMHNFRLYTQIYKLNDWIEHTIKTMDMYSDSQGGHLLLRST